MNDLDMDALLSPDDDDPPRRRGSGARSTRGRRRRRQRRQRRKGYAASLLAVAIVVGILGAGGYFGYNWARDLLIPDDYTGRGTGEVIVEIKEGQNASDVAQTLEDLGVVKSARAFTNAVSAANKSSSLQPGEYKLRKQMAAEYAVSALEPKNRLLTQLTITEGLRLSQVLEKLSTATGRPLEEFEKAAKHRKAIGLPSYARSLEGYAFPATYEVSPKKSAEDLLTVMVDRYRAAARQADLTSRAKDLGMTPAQIMTIASIVQAESGNVSDMPKVSRVIYNRLALNPPMKLQMDSTLMYGLGKFGIAATNAELNSKSPYNTYRRAGLPPGPISNPGDHAIEAALHPAKGSWLFFVTVDPEKGITKFTDSEAEFFKLRDQFNKNHGAG
jgi:conserved hypothetical protein, YceG family